MEITKLQSCFNFCTLVCRVFHCVCKFIYFTNFYVVFCPGLKGCKVIKCIGFETFKNQHLFSFI